MGSRYKDELTRAMEYAANRSDSIFLGQAVAVQGTAMRGTLETVDPSKLLELPVEEELQMGMSIGLAMTGFLPISIFPRWNFLLLATNQIVNHLDKLGEMLGNQAVPKVIIRTAIGSENPLDPGPQHKGDYTEAFRILAPGLNVVRLDETEMIFPEYKKAIDREDGVSTILVEWGDFYGTK